MALEPAQTVDPDRELEVADVVVHINSTFRCSEENCAAIWRPLDKLKTNLELFAPKSRSFDGTDNDGAIFVDDTNLFTIWCPAHVCDDTLVSIVDHLLKPVRLVEHPYNDETLLVTRGQLLILVVPLEYHDVALMAL